MADSRARSHFSDRLTSRRGAWIALAVALMVMVGMFGLFSGAEAPTGAGQAPAGAESTQVSALLDEFENSDQQPVLIVADKTLKYEVVVHAMDTLRRQNVKNVSLFVQSTGK